jgi:hypothetical protein
MKCEAVGRPTAKTIAAVRRETMPSYATIPVWGELSGFSRASTYRALAAGNLRAIKIGRSVRIDVEHGLAWLAAMPSATFGQRAGKPPRRAAQ